jgi:methionine--tRNA ligase beta chain
MQKILIVYYSRTGTTKRIAEFLAQHLKCDLEEIVSAKNRNGALGYMLCGREATLKNLPKIEPVTKNPEDYDLIIFGTPVWAWNISSPLRTYLAKNKNKFKNISAFCTMSHDGDRQSFSEIEKICGKKLVAKIGIKTKNAKKANLNEQLEKFIKNIEQPKTETEETKHAENTISIDEFAKIQIRIGKILSAEKINGADKLLKLKVDFGEPNLPAGRQVLAGIAQYYEPENLVGKECPFVYNLAPRTMRGLESQGMILCPSGESGPVLLHPDKGVPPGSVVK